MSCLGDALAALVDGELDDAGRERALRHLARCDVCRAEVDGLRRLKARLSGLVVPSPPDDLTARLLRLGGQPPERDALPVLPVGPVRPPGRPAASTRPGRPRPGRAVRRRATTGSAFALLGVAAALALGTPASRPATTPVDPASEAFVTEFVGTADGVPGPVVGVPATGTTSLTTFVPVTRTALLTTGGARTTR